MLCCVQFAFLTLSLSFCCRHIKLGRYNQKQKAAYVSVAKGKRQRAAELELKARRLRAHTGSCAHTSACFLTGILVADFSETVQEEVTTDGAEAEAAAAAASVDCLKQVQLKAGSLILHAFDRQRFLPEDEEVPVDEQGKVPMPGTPGTICHGTVLRFCESKKR